MIIKAFCIVVFNIVFSAFGIIDLKVCDDYVLFINIVLYGFR